MKIVKLYSVLTVLFFSLLMSPGVVAQEGKLGKKLDLKNRGTKLRENIGKGVLKLMTAKTDQLSLISARAAYISGMYPLYTETSDVDFYPESIEEGDHVLMVSFLKNEGMGVFKLEGTVTHNGQEMTYIGGGAYLIEVDKNDLTSKTIEVVANSGQKATITINPISEVEILEVNGEKSFPVIDMEEDMTMKFNFDLSDEETQTKLAFLTDAGGARFWNRFGEHKSKTEVTIPKESFGNAETTASVAKVANFNKGNNYLLAERTKKIEATAVGENKGDFANLEIYSTAYYAMPSFIKGEQGLGTVNYLSLREKVHSPNGTLEIEMSKPNAVNGIPFSEGQTFGLASLRVKGKTYESSTSESTRYDYALNTKTITTTTVTYKFPTLSDEVWQGAMAKFNDEFSARLKSQLDIDMIEVEKITSSVNYATYPTNDKNTYKVIDKTYKDTKRTEPQSVGEIFRGVSMNMSSDKPEIHLMKETETNGLVVMNIEFQVAGQDGKVVLIPVLKIAIEGRNAKGANESVVYGNIVVKGFNGVPFNEGQVKSNSEALYKTLRGPELMDAAFYGLSRLQAKEKELGYEKIWEIK